MTKNKNSSIEKKKTKTLKTMNKAMMMILKKITHMILMLMKIWEISGKIF